MPVQHLSIKNPFLAMAATDSFESFVSALTEMEQKHVAPYIKAQREDLLAARSEDARLRIVNAFVEEVHRLLKQTRR
jgi:hypothetical protein